MLVKKRCVSPFISFLFIGLFAQTFVVPMSYAMQPSQGATGDSGKPPQELSIFGKLKFDVQSVLKRAVNNKVKTASQLLPFTDLVYPGSSSVASLFLHLTTRRFQDACFGTEEVPQEIVNFIRGELKELKIPNYDTIPIKFKEGSFSATSSSYEALIFHPTNSCIYVDRFLLQQSTEIQRKLIRRALPHYFNNTFKKLLVGKAVISGFGLYVLPKISAGITNLIHRGWGALSNPTANTIDNSQALVPMSQDSSYSLKSFLQRLSSRVFLGSVVGFTTVCVYSALTNPVLDKYVDAKQEEYDEKEFNQDDPIDKRKFAAILLLKAAQDDLANLEALERRAFKLINISDLSQKQKNLLSEFKNAKNNKDRINSLKAFACNFICDELNQEWNSLVNAYTNFKNQKKRMQFIELLPKVSALMGGFNSIFEKLPEEDSRKTQVRQNVAQLADMLKLPNE